MTPKGDCVSHAISIRKFQGSETSKRTATPRHAAPACGAALKATPGSQHAAVLRLLRREGSLLYPKRLPYKVDGLDKRTHLAKEQQLVPNRLHLTLSRPTNRCSLSQLSSLIDSAFCFKRSSRYSCPRFARSDSEKRLSGFKSLL